MINLKNDAKRDGALDALSLLLSSKSRPIRVKKGEEEEDENGLKMPQNVETIDVDEEDKLNGEDETEEEKEERLRQAAEDDTPEAIARDMNTMKNELAAAKAEREAREKEAARIEHEEELRVDAKKISSGQKHLDYSWFYNDLENAINDQIEQSNSWEDSYDSFNATYAGSGALMPGEKRGERKLKPIINVYFDKSGSLSDETIDKAKESLSFLNDLEASGDIEEYNIYYFSDNVSDKEEDMRGGTGGYPDILRHIKQIDADNVIIFTDDDFDHPYQYQPNSDKSDYANSFRSVDQLPYITVDGCVWWVWADGETAKRAWKHLVSSNPTATYHYDLK